MTIYSWPENVPSKAYGVQPGYADNVIRKESDSGLVLQYAKNTYTQKTYTFGVHMTKKQYALFDAWFKDVLGGGAAPFYFPSLDGNPGMVAYYMTEPPDPSTGQTFKDVSISVIEAVL